jgi:uncharacterized protein (DUF2141 family)
MSMLLLICLSSLVPSWPSLSAAESTTTSDLIVHASGFKHARGHAIAKLFWPGENVLAKGHVEVRADIHDGEATLTFSSVQAGNYAVVVFHDENDNGVIDHGTFGPKEPIGFSNGFHLGLFSGFPSFEKLRFAFAPEHNRIEVTVR